MAVYVCRKDGYDLSADVERALADEGGDVLNIDVLVEGRSDDSGFSEETFLDSEATRSRDDVIQVVVTCPQDDVVNVFSVVRRS